MVQVSQETPGVEGAHPGYDDDDELLECLGDAIDRFDPVPAHVLADASAVFEARLPAPVARSSCSRHRPSCAR